MSHYLDHRTRRVEAHVARSGGGASDRRQAPLRGRARAAAHRARFPPFRSSSAYAGEPAREPPEHAGARSRQARVRSGESARAAMAVHEPADRPAPARACPRQLHGIRGRTRHHAASAGVELAVAAGCARLRARDHSRHAADVVGERVLEPYAAQLAAGRLRPSVRPRRAALEHAGDIVRRPRAPSSAAWATTSSRAPPQSPSIRSDATRCRKCSRCWARRRCCFRPTRVPRTWPAMVGTPVIGLYARYQSGP